MLKKKIQEEDNVLQLEQMVNPEKKETLNPDAGEDIDSSDVISLMAIKELLSEDNLETTSRIKPEQVIVLSKLILYGELFNVLTATNLAIKLLKLQISINGLGRKELVQLVQKRVEDITTQKMITSKEIFR